ncbi:MAG: lysylphosphatidylglycerol synthase transmembrane domain-containing protein [Rhodospirillales bacterium]
MSISPRSFLRLVLIVIMWPALAWFFMRTLDGLPAAENWPNILTPEMAAPIGLFIILFVVAAWLRTMRWRGLLPHELQTRPGLFSVYVWAFFIAVIAPFRTGELIRPAWVHHQGGSFADGAGAVVSERLADVVAIAGLLALCIVARPQTATDFTGLISEELLIVAPALFAGLLIAHLTGTLSARHLQRRLPKDAATSGLTLWTSNLLKGLSRAASAAAYVKLMGLTFLIWALLTAGHIVILTAMLPSLHWSGAVAVVTSVNLAGMLPVSPGNIGFYEAAAVAVLAAYGVPPEPALAVAFLVHVVVLAMTCTLGLAGRLHMARQGVRLSDLV